MKKLKYSVDCEGDIEIDMGDDYVFLTKDDLLIMLEEIKKWEDNE